MSLYASVNLDGIATQSNFSFSFGYLAAEHIHVYIDGVETFDFTFLSAQIITLDTPLVADALVRIARATPISEPIVDYNNGSVLGETDLDAEALQGLYATQEIRDTATTSLILNDAGLYDVANVRIINVGTPTDANDAATKSYVDPYTAAAITANLNAQIANTNAQIANSFTQTANTNAQTANTNAWVAVAILQNTAYSNAGNAYITSNNVFLTANTINATGSLTANIINCNTVGNINSSSIGILSANLTGNISFTNFVFAGRVTGNITANIATMNTTILTSSNNISSDSISNAYVEINSTSATVGNLLSSIVTIGTMFQGSLVSQANVVSIAATVTNANLVSQANVVSSATTVTNANTVTTSNNTTTTANIITGNVTTVFTGTNATITGNVTTVTVGTDLHHSNIGTVSGAVSVARDIYNSTLTTSGNINVTVDLFSSTISMSNGNIIVSGNANNCVTTITGNVTNANNNTNLHVQGNVTDANNNTNVYVQGNVLGNVTGNVIVSQSFFQSITGTATIGANTRTAALSGASFTLTLNTAVGKAGQLITLIHNGTSLTQEYTIDGSGVETIDGTATYILYTNKERLTIASDGANWLVMEHSATTAWANSGAVTINATSVNPTKADSANTTVDMSAWKREGDQCYFRYDYMWRKGAAIATNGTGDYLLVLPTGLSIATPTPHRANTILFDGASQSNWLIAQLPTTGTLSHNSFYINSITCAVYNTNTFRLAYIDDASYNTWGSITNSLKGTGSTVDSSIILEIRFTHANWRT